MEIKDGEQLIDIEPIESSPFVLIGNNNMGYAIAIGNKRLTDKFDSKEECIKFLETPSWNFFTNFIVAITQTYDEIEHKQEPSNGG